MASSGGMTNTSVGQRHDSMHSIYYYKIMFQEFHNSDSFLLPWDLLQLCSYGWI